MNSLTRWCRHGSRADGLPPQVLTEQVGRLVDGIVDGTQLCIDAGRAAWLAYLDIYVLDAGAAHMKQVTMLATYFASWHHRHPRCCVRARQVAKLPTLQADVQTCLECRRRLSKYQSPVAQ